MTMHGDVEMKYLYDVIINPIWRNIQDGGLDEIKGLL